MRIKLREHNLDIDVMNEIEEFPWVNSVIRGDEFCACSPFRSEKHPSFGINMETGLWRDLGSSDDYYKQGNLIKLLSYMRAESNEDTVGYLVSKYAVGLRDEEALELHLQLYGEVDTPKYFRIEDLSSITFSESKYLSRRGISSEIQAMFNTGYLEGKNTVALPWMDKKGNIINVKYRRTDTKKFFYEKSGQQIGNFVYGLYQCLLINARRVFICESEIDALTLWTYGFPAVALGGSHLSDSQKSTILSCGIEEWVIATDNDKVGRSIADMLVRELGGSLKLFMLPFPEDKKDINEMTGKQVREAVFQIKPPVYNFIKIGVDR